MAKPGFKKKSGSMPAGSAAKRKKRGRMQSSHNLDGKVVVAAPDSAASRPAIPSKPKRRERSDQFKPVDKTAETKPVYDRPAPQGARLAEHTALILETSADKNYALLDSGRGRKLERYGPLTIVRPEAQAIWQPLLPQSRWDAADAVFTGDTDEEGVGRWQFPHSSKPLDEKWPMEFDGIPFWGRFTSFRHVGVFPEQAAHWRFMEAEIASASKNLGRAPRVLNLFGYTGVASLVAACAGAEVTHVDASRKAIGWGRENQELAGLENAPIRWICDDAMKFSAREVRRGQTYDGILLDPPAYGRGPKGEVWQLFDNLTEQLDLCRAMLSPQAQFVVLTAYAIRASFFACHEIMQECFAGTGGKLESGELILRQEGAKRALSTSMFSRWTSGVDGGPADE